MNVLYILVLSLPLMNGLVNNNTGTCQCICQKPYLGQLGGQECKNYKSLTDSTRKLNVPASGTNKRADRLGGSYPSFDWKGEGWYRVMGGAGTRIPENPFTSVQSIGWKHCKNYCPGYLPSGSHPQTPGKLVDNVKVCYNCDYKYFNSKTMCNYNDFNAIKIRHCGDYFVYYLTQSYNENFRYCTE